LTEKVIHKEIRSLVPESQAYVELLRLEQKLDTVLMRKRLDLQETLKRPQKVIDQIVFFSSQLSFFFKIKKKLRIFISHQYPVRFDSDTTGIDDEQVQYWEMRVEGRLLDDVSSEKQKLKKYFRILFLA